MRVRGDMDMLYGDVRRKKMHTEECPHACLIRSRDLVLLPNALEGHAMRYSYCDCCNPLREELRVQREKVAGRLQVYGFACYFEEDRFCIESELGQWYLVSDQAYYLALYHRNTKGDLEGYHLQSAYFRDIAKALDYIAGHDTYVASAKKPKKHRRSKARDRVTSKVAAQRKEHLLRREEERLMAAWMAYGDVAEDYAYVV